MTIYEKIRELCKNRGETVTGVEKKLGFARGSLSKIDKNKPSVDRVQKLANHFGLPVEFFSDENAEESPRHYIGDETVALAQAIFENPSLRVLFDAAKDLTPEDIRIAVDMLKRFKETNPDG